MKMVFLVGALCSGSSLVLSLVHVASGGDSMGGIPVWPWIAAMSVTTAFHLWGWTLTRAD